MLCTGFIVYDLIRILNGRDAYMHLVEMLEGLSGVIVPLVTPYFEGELDEDSIKNLLERLYLARVSGVFPSSTTGESVLLTREERMRMLSIVVDNSNLPVWAGIPQPSTGGAIREAVEALDIGANGVVLYTPYYYSHTDQALYSHWDKILSAIDGKAIIYLIPSHTCNKPEPTILKDLAENHSNLIGIKVTTTDVAYFSSIINALEDTRVTVMPGDVRLLPLAVARGHNAAVLGVANVMPKSSENAIKELQSGGTRSYSAVLSGISILQEGRLQCILKASLNELKVIKSSECKMPIGKPTERELLVAKRLAELARLYE